MYCDDDPHAIPARYAGAVRLFEEMNRMRRTHFRHRTLPSLRKNDTETLHMLLFLTHYGQNTATAGQMARKTGLSMPVVSQRVGSLEALGLVRRKPDPDDRRQVQIQLTPKGLELARGSRESFFGEIEAALEKIGPEKTEQLVGLMSQFNDALDLLENHNEEAEQ